jgi:small-conductance mechanosensitive channel
MNVRALKRLVWPTVTLVTVLYLGLPWLNRHSPQVQENFIVIVAHVVGAMLGFSVSWFIVRLLDVLVWRLLESRTGNQIPGLFRDLVAFLVFLSVGLIIAGTIFEYPVKGIWTATGLAGLVVGFALRDMIADVFSGIAINIDQPFKIGEWIQVHPRSVDPDYGCVTEISWRSTRLRKTDNTLLVIPNSLVSSILITNFSRPSSVSRFALDYTFEFGVATERGLRVLLAGVKSSSVVLADPEPIALVNRTTQHGVEYRVRYWIDAAEVSPRRARHEVNLRILDHLHHAGITPAYGKQDLYLARMPNRQLDRCEDLSALLERVEIFRWLEPDEMEQIANAMTERRFASGEVVVGIGQPGDSMYIVLEGLLSVHSSDDISAANFVGRVEPGEFFGEMSLLTGETRLATVVTATDTVLYEVCKANLQKLKARTAA